MIISSHSPTRDRIHHILTSGGLAAIGTSTMAAMLGYLESREPVAPLNSVSHILFGEEAAAKNRASFKFTVTGLALNAAAVTSWAVMHEMLVGEKPVSAQKAMACGAATATTAYVVDYAVVPSWLTPGFEKRLSQQSVITVFSTLAFTLAASSLFFRR